MKPNYKFHGTSLSQNRRSSSIINFKGVDYASQRFNVASYHAIDINNFIYRDGVTQKRFGTEQLIQIEPMFYIPLSFNEGVGLENEYKVNTTNVNGLWHFRAEDGKEHIIAHIGKLLYEVVDFKSLKVLGDDKTFTYNGNIYHYAYEFEDYKSSAFVGANRFYFLGGNKYMILRFLSDGSYRFDLAEKDSYIPTTTISITYKNSTVAGRQSLDKVNLLNRFRKNECLSGTIKREDEKTKTDFYDYTLDAPLITKSIKDYSDILITISERGTIK